MPLWFDRLTTSGDDRLTTNGSAISRSFVRVILRQAQGEWGEDDRLRVSGSGSGCARKVSSGLAYQCGDNVIQPLGDNVI